MGFLKDVETFLLPADILADEGIPSVSIAWLDNPSGNTQCHTITKGRENTETIYQACSISKAITALAVAKLVDQGRLTYDTKVVDHIPQSILESIGSEYLMVGVTVGRLLSHTSGLSGHGFHGYLGEDLPTYEDIFAGRAPANNQRLRFSSFPGSEMRYSGGGYTLLQVFLEKFTGTNFAYFMRQTVLEPLGMNRSVFGDLSYQEKNYAQAHFTAHTLGTTGRGYHRFAELAAAGLWSTPSDLLKATSAIQASLYSGVPGSPRTFLSQETARAMLTKAHPNPPEPTRQTAMGWFIDSTFFAHAGANEPGYTCYLLANHSTTPQTSPFSLAIMTNSTLGFPMIKKLIAAIFAMRRVSFYPNLPGGISSMSDFVPLTAPESIRVAGWERWAGHWGDDWEIYEDDGLPMVAWDGSEMPHRLIHAASESPVVEGVLGFIFKIEGVEMGIRLVPGVGGTKWIEIIGDSVKVLERSRAYTIEP